MVDLFPSEFLEQRPGLRVGGNDERRCFKGRIDSRDTRYQLWVWKIPAPRQAVLQDADRDQDHFYVAMGHIKAL
jgi:hypothetical protein